MLDSMEKEFPDVVTFTKPTGGMFIWANLNGIMSSMELFHEAKKQKVAFVPGNPFYTDGRETDTLRLNYTNASQDMIREGIARLGSILIINGLSES